MTPLLVACSNMKILIIKSYLDLGSDSRILDNSNHSAIWHLFHPAKEILKSGEEGKKYG